MKKLFVYKTINLKNNKIYIGKHETVNENDNYLGSGLLLKRSIEKHGIENFKREIIEYCETTEQLNELEKYWIKLLDSTNKKIGYNIMPGGDGGDNFTNHPNKDLLRIRYSLAQKGKKISELCKQKISEANKGEKNGMYGVKHSPEIREKISEAGRNRKHSEESKKKMSDSKKGITFSEDHRKNLSQNHKGMKGMKHSEESLERMRNVKRGCVLNKPYECENCKRKISTLHNLNIHMKVCKK